MPDTVSPVSPINLIDPSYAPSMMELQRRQQLANVLRAQGLAPMGQTEMAGRVAIRKSPIEGMAKMYAAYLSGQQDIENQGYADEIGKSYSDHMRAMFGLGSANPQTASDVALSAGAQQGDVGPTNSNAARMAEILSQGQPQANPQSSGGMLNYPGMPPGQSMAMFSMMGPEKYVAALMDAKKPTDLQKNMGAAKTDPLMNAWAKKETYIAPTSMRPGGIAVYPDGRQEQMPSAIDGAQAVRGPDGQWAYHPIPNALSAISAASQAQASGPASYRTEKVFNPNTNQYELQTATNIAGAAGVPAPMANNNPGALMPGGKIAKYPDLQTGIAALDKNLESYGKQGINTISGVISKWAPPGENNTAAYIKDVSSRLGISPDQPIDLSNPLHRQMLSTAIALHESGPKGVFGGAPQRAMAAEPPLGTTANANASQEAGAASMKASYDSLQKARAGGSAAVQDIDHMLKLGERKNPLIAGTSATNAAKLFSADAAVYEKSRDNLVTQLSGQMGLSTDAARDMVYGSIPPYGAPREAIKDGLENLKNQVGARMMKADFLTEHFNKGDSKAYNAKENEFDQNISPAIVKILQMPSSKARADALEKAKEDPKRRASLEWSIQNGLLK